MAAILEKLNRFRQRLAGSAEAMTQVPYEIRCHCGNTVKGIRRSSWVEGECSKCYESLFVLPANVYPATKAVPSTAVGGTFNERFSAAWTELFPPKPDEPKPAKKSKSKKGARAAADAQQEPRRFRLPRPDIAGAFRRTFTPFRLIILAIIGVIGFTGYWVVRDRAQTSAQQVWLDTTEDLPDILQENRIADLQTTLEQTLAAAATLGKEGDDVRRYANLYKEASAANAMISLDFSDCMSTGYDREGKLFDGAAGIVQDTISAGAFVFDTRLQPVSSDGRKWGFELPAIDGTHGIKVVVECPRLAIVPEDIRVLFAARVSSVESPSPENFETWQLELDADSFVLLTSENVAEYMGLPMEGDDMQNLLQQQEGYVLAWSGSGDSGENPVDEFEQETPEGAADVE